jgi:phenylacetate-coenzyme A ligase PaaK-like adenylate-forming protein
LGLEIVRPGTGDPVPEGEVGEIVVTVLDLDRPLIRYAGPSSRGCGRRPAGPP